MAAADIGQRSRREAFRFGLRAATQAEHAALDQHPAFSSLTGGTLDIASYQQLMLQMYGFYDKHDATLDEACRLHSLSRLGFVYRPRAEILKADLIDLGTTAPFAPFVPLNGSLQQIGSAAALGGMLYVLEGSLLGGALLCRAAETLLTRTGAKGNGYWQWCRDVGAKRWAATCAVLEALATTDDNRQELIDGAKVAFKAFASWMIERQDTLPIDGMPVGSLERC
ncbi:MAG: biliverdin-producing heme oxygenase [Hyphomicrobiales bacterium]|nr:biliverdin-producing heme oxygenase [Hyphomicrobiales bacterium]